MIFEDKTPAYLITDALYDYSAAVKIISRNNPLQVELNGRLYNILINRTHDSGEGRVNPDECRIQLNANQINVYKPGFQNKERTLVCGYDLDKGVFTTWEAEHVLEREPATFSIYSRFSALTEAQVNGVSIYEFRSNILGRSSRAISFMPEYFGLIIENLDSVFKLDINGLYEARDFFDDSQPVSVASTKDVNVQEETVRGEPIEITRIEYSRNPRFRREVMRAYNHQCCICGIQLGTVDAAHIIPHSDENSNDTVSNGLALCANHHRAYDSGLLSPDENYSISINKERANYLIENGIDGGLDQLRDMEGQNITLPEDQEQWPNTDYLREGYKIRQS